VDPDVSVNANDTFDPIEIILSRDKDAFDEFLPAIVRVRFTDCDIVPPPDAVTERQTEALPSWHVPVDRELNDASSDVVGGPDV
jgi:hypothetical protein